MKTITVRRIDLKGSIHSELHKINIPNQKDDGFYRTMISYDAFFESCKRRNQNDKYLYVVNDDNRTERLLKQVNDPNRSEILRDVDKWEIDRDSKLPVIKHENLFEFFNYIGYDRKRKKILIKE